MNKIAELNELRNKTKQALDEKTVEYTKKQEEHDELEANRYQIKEFLDKIKTYKNSKKILAALLGLIVACFSASLITGIILSKILTVSLNPYWPLFCLTFSITLAALDKNWRRNAANLIKVRKKFKGLNVAEEKSKAQEKLQEITHKIWLLEEDLPKLDEELISLTDSLNNIEAEILDNIGFSETVQEPVEEVREIKPLARTRTKKEN